MGGQATVHELKELNLETKEDPRPIYMSTMLTPEEDKQLPFTLLIYERICMELQGNA